MALKDPKVPIFALMSCCMLVGTGFANFFPTYVHSNSSYCRSDPSTQDRGDAWILNDNDTTACCVWMSSYRDGRGTDS